MIHVDWDRIRLEKDTYRAFSASLPFNEKLRVLERLRERAKELREAMQK